MQNMEPVAGEMERKRPPQIERKGPLARRVCAFLCSFLLKPFVRDECFVGTEGIIYILTINFTLQSENTVDFNRTYHVLKRYVSGAGRIT